MCVLKRPEEISEEPKHLRVTTHNNHPPPRSRVSLPERVLHPELNLSIDISFLNASQPAVPCLMSLTVPSAWGWVLWGTIRRNRNNDWEWKMPVDLFFSLFSHATFQG